MSPGSLTWTAFPARQTDGRLKPRSVASDLFMRHSAACPDSAASPLEFRSLSWLFVRALTVCFVLGLASIGQSQDKGEGTPGTVLPRPVSTGTAVPAPRIGDSIWIRGEDGKSVQVQLGLTLAELRELILASQKPVEQPPSFYVATLSITGAVDDNLKQATLKVVIDVVLQKDSSARVPLRLAEGTLLGQTYAGQGTVSFEPPTRSEELVCWFRGLGNHELTLEVSVPIRKSAIGYRILLSLPPSLINSLDLTIPRGRVQARHASEKTRHETTVIDPTKSLLQAHNLGTAIDLTWQEAPTQNVTKVELQSQTLIETHAEADDVRLEVTQTVASQSSFQEVFVQIPAGFAVSSLADENFPDLTWEMAASHRVRIDTGTLTRRVDLHWILTTLASGVNVGSEQPVLVSGLSVEGATRQDGLIALTVAEGFSVDVSQSRSVRRLGISSFRRLAGARLRNTSQSFRSAWQFENAAFQISLKRTKIVPSFVVRPRYTLTLGENDKPEAVLTAVFDMQVFRGKLDRVELFWPNYQKENWSELDITEPQSGAEVLLPEAGGKPDHVILLLEESISRSEAKSVQFQCSRPISLDAFPIDGDKSFPLSLPVPVAQRQSGFQLTVKNGGSIESKLVAADGTSVAVIPSDNSDNAFPKNTRQATWDITSGQLQFAARIQSFGQKTSSETTVAATLTDKSCLVVQTFHYDVAYRKLTEVRLLVPAGRTPQFWLQSPRVDGRRSLAPQLTGVELDGRVQFRLDLNPDLWGRFQIIAQYELPLGEESSQEERLVIPVLTSSDATVSRTHLEIRSPDNLRVVPEEGAGWKPELTVSRVPGWSTDAERREVPLSLRFSQELAEQNFTIRRAMIETRFLPNPRSQAAYLIDGDVSFLTIRFPNTVDLSRRIVAWWDGRELTGEQFRPVSENSREFAIRTGDFPQSEQHVLAVEFDSDSDTRFGGLNRLSVAAPQFAPDVWLAETQWNIVLPVGQHLAIYPQDYSPRFQWERQIVFWDRQPIAGQPSPGRWLLAELDSDTATDTRQLVPFDWFGGTAFGNSYRFSNFGGRHQIEFQSMSQPAIVLCGAGFALAIGFILLRIPATRHVLTFLSLGFALAAIALWQPEAVQLLVQPAIFGMLLAIMASVLEHRTRRSHQASLVTLTSPDDFLAESDDEIPLHVEHPVQVEEAVEDDSAA